MNILALESYYGGSHKAFLDDLSRISKHTWTTLTLPAHMWKWRMRHSAITFAGQVRELVENGQSWDILFCSDMLNLAEFVALAPAEVAGLPRIIYFHENQLTYPVRFASERDYQYVMTNLTSALSADAVWFNSEFHKDSFLEAMIVFLKSMPDRQPTEVVEQIRAKAAVYPPGIDDISGLSDREPGPLRILWAARWEHDKNPEVFFAALKILKANNTQFRLSVIGQSFLEQPEIFALAKRDFRDQIDRWGYQANRSDYQAVLKQADVIVSTANHEFFGIGVLEGVSVGAYPVVPKRLSYPEILGLGKTKAAEKFFYNGTAEDLAKKLTELAQRIQTEPLWIEKLNSAVLTDRFKWANLASTYDDALEQTQKNRD